MNALAFLLGLAVAVLLGAPAPAQTAITGTARVIDGDSLEVAGHAIRLWGIDAPERGQTCREADGKPWDCGEIARTFMIVLLWAGKQRAECLVEHTDMFGRFVATCSVDGQDLGEAMVRAGFAVDWPRYSKGAYAAAEKGARENKRGMWRGAFDLPRDFRRSKGNAR